ncbi:hypothetical protein [Rariglobus hedericola]|uniref:Uncharacterized protein n=1 Tax=Rariglobus hedericola TaxID=2597822 RepID=A0A556QK95_9BACT|nr:hypothetical protein [Rariglobus hedericola]TSJ77048.1 hypothetical protein FPL22_13165 [Rariglobus hedericola]
MSAVVPVHDEAPWKAGLRSARANLIPGLVLQAFALAVVLGYYFHAPTRTGLTRLAELRNDTGVLFGIFTTGLCGGLLPLLYLKAAPSTRRHITWPQGWGLTAFWSYKGWEIALWYGFMAWTLGEAADVRTIAAKSLLDQFVYCPIWAIPTTALVYLWCQNGFNHHLLIADLRTPRWYARRVLPLLLANLGVWLPLVCIIYALPTPLQLPLQNIVLCFFTLMLAHMAREPSLIPAE